MFISVAVFRVYDAAFAEMDAPPAFVWRVSLLHVLSEYFRVIDGLVRVVLAIAVKVAAVDYDCVFLHSASFIAMIE